MAEMCNYSQVLPWRESPVWVIYVRDVHVITQCPLVLENISLAATVSLHKLLCEATTKSINNKIYWTSVKVYSSEVQRLHKCVISDFALFIDLQTLLSYTANKSFCTTQLLVHVVSRATPCTVDDLLITTKRSSVGVSCRVLVGLKPDR
jgi:hypothetical protein